MKFLYAAMMLWAVYFSCLVGFAVGRDLWLGKHRILAVLVGVALAGAYAWLAIGADLGLYPRTD